MSSSSGSSSASGSGSSSSSGSASGSSSARDGSSSARDGSSAPLTSARTDASESRSNATSALNASTGGRGGAAPRGEGSWSAPVIEEGGGRGHRPATSATGGPPPSYPAPGALQLAREQRKALQKKVQQFTREELSSLTRHSAFEIATQNETTTKHFRKRLYLESAYKPGTELPEDVTALSLRLLRDVTTVVGGADSFTTRNRKLSAKEKNSGKAMTLLNLERSLFTLRLKGRQPQQSQKDYEKHHIRFSRMKPGVTYLDFVRVVKAELGYSTEEAELLFWDVLNPENITDTELLFWLKLENHKPLAFTGTEKAPADEDEDKASKPHQENEALLSELCAETVPKVFLTRDRFRRYLECTERRVRDAERRRFRFDYKDVDGLLDRFVFLYGSLLCAWRVLFDPGCSGAPVPWATFRKKLADHSECNARLLWNFLAPFESSQLSAEQSRIYFTNVVEVENQKATSAANANLNHQEHYRRPQQSLLLQLRDFDLDGYLLLQDLGRAVLKLHLTPELCWYEYDLNQKEVLFFSDFQIMLADLNLHKDTWRELWVALSDAEHKVLKKEVFCKTVVNYFFSDWAGGMAAQVGKRASMEIVQTQNKKHPPAVSVSKGSDGAVLAPAPLSAVVLPSVLPSCMTDEEAAVHFCKWVRYRYRTMNMLWREIANKHGDGKFLLPYVSPEQFQRVLHRSGYGNAAAIVGILVTREVARGKWRVMAARLAAAAGAPPGTSTPTTPSSAAAPGTTATTKLTGLMLLELHQSACLLAPYLNQPDDRRLLSATGERQTDQRDEVEMNLITFDFGRWINDPFARHWQSLRDYYSIFCRERAFLPKRLFLRWLQSRQYAGLASGEFVFRFMVTLDANLPGGHVHETMSKQHRPRRMYSPYWSLDDVAQLERFLRLKRGGPAVENIGVATVQPTLSLLESFPGALQWEATVLISLLLKKYASLGMVWRHVLGGAAGPIGFLPFSRGTREFHRNVNISRVYEIFVFFTSHACMGRAGSGGGLHQLDGQQPDVLHQNDEDTIIDRLDRDTQFLVQNDSSLDSHTLRNRCAVSTELTARAHIQQRQLDAAVSKPLPRMRLLIRNRSDWNQFSRDFIADNALSYRAFNPRGDATLGIFTKQMWLAYGGKFERVVQDCGSSPGDGKHLGSGGVAMNLDDFFLLCVQLFGPGVIDASYVCEYLLSCLLAGGNRAGGDRCSAITSSSDIALYAAAPAVGGKGGTPEEEQKNEGAEPIVPVSASDAMAICKYLAGGGGAGADTGRTRYFDPFCYSRFAAHSSDYFTKGFDVTELHSPAMETMKKTYTQWQARYENKAAPAGGNGIKAASYSAVEGGKALDAEVAENEVEIARLSAPAAAPRVSSAEAAEGGPRRPTARDVLQGAGDGSPGSRDEILRSSAETESRGDSTSSPEQLRSSVLTTEPRRRSIATRWQSKLKIYAPEIGEIADEVAEPTTSPVVAPRSMGGSIPPVLGNRGRLTIADIRQLSSIAKQNGKASTSSTPISVQQLRGGGATGHAADGIVDEDQHNDSVDVDGNAPPMTFFADTNLDLQDEVGSAAASSGREASTSGPPLNAAEEVDLNPEDVGRSRAEQDVGLKAEDDVDLKAEDVDFKELGLGVSFSEVASEATQDQGIVDEAAFGADLDSVLTATAGTGELQGPAALLLPPVASPTEEEMHTIESRYGFVTDGGDFVKFLMQQARMLEKPTCMAALAHYQYFGTPKLRGTGSGSAPAGPHSLGVLAAHSLTSLESLLRRNATSWREEDVEKLVEGGKEFFFAAVKQMCVGAGISPVSRRPTVRNLVTGGYHAPKFGGASNAASVAELQAKAAAELCSTTSGALKTRKKEKEHEHQLPDEEDGRKNVREQRDALPALCPVSWEDLVYDVFVTLLPTRTEKPFLQSIEMEHLKLLYGYLPAQRPDLYSNEDLALHLARHLLFQHGVGRLFFKTHASANLYGRAAVLGLWGDLMESEKLYAEEKKKRRGERTMAALRGGGGMLNKTPAGRGSGEAGAGDPSFQPKLRGGAKKNTSTSSSSSGSGTSSSKSSSSAVTSSSASSSSRPSSSAASGGTHKKKAPVAEGEASPFSSSPNTARSSTDSIPFRKVPAPSEEQKQNKAPPKRITFREFSGILRAYNINTDEVRIFLILWHIERFNRIPSAADIFLEQNVNLNHGDAPVYVKRTKKLDQDFLAMYFAQLQSAETRDAGGPAQESAKTSFDPKKEFYITRYALDFLIHRYINSDPFIVEQVDKELQKGRIPLVDAAAADQRGPKEEESGGGTKKEKSQRGNRGGGGNGNQATDVDELPEEVILYQFVNYHGQGSAWRKLLALTPMSPGISHFRFRTFAAICGYDERYVGRLASLVVTLGGRQWKPFVTHEDLQVCTRVLLNQKMNGLPVGTDVARIETASSAVISKADANKSKSPRASAALAARVTINSNRMFVADSHNRSPVEERASLRSVEVDAKTKSLHGEKPFDLNTFAQRIPGETRVADGFFSYMESNATAATKKKSPTWRAAK
eukprot:g10454.t1